MLIDDPEENEFVQKYGHFRGLKITDVLPVLERISKDNFDEWTWCYNSPCKYFDILIDTRNGGWVHIKDRDGNLLSLEEVEYQWTRE